MDPTTHRILKRPHPARVDTAMIRPASTVNAVDRPTPARPAVRARAITASAPTPASNAEASFYRWLLGWVVIVLAAACLQLAATP